MGGRTMISKDKSALPFVRAACSGLLGGVSLLAIGAAPALAQGDEASGEARDVITVTAEFRERSLQDTPLAITALSGEAIDARSAVTITDLAGYVPSTWLTEGRGQFGGGVTAFMRGIGQFNMTPAFEPGVGVYVDDIYMATMQATLFNLVDLERVEVLRGPQGTLAGKNSIGGAIKLFSKKPQGDGSGYAQLTYGSNNRIEGRAAADFAVTDDLAMRVNVAGRNEDGYVDILDYGCVNPGSGLYPVAAPEDGCRTGTAQGLSYVGGRVALRWTPSDAIEINLAGDYTNDSSEAGADQLTAITNAALVPPTTVNGVGVLPDMVTYGTYTTYSDWCNVAAFGGAGAYCNERRGDTDTWGGSATVDIALNENVTLKSITGYRGFRSHIHTDNDGTPIPIGNHRVNFHGDQFSQELRLNANLADSLNVTVGGYYIDSDVDNDSRIDIQYFGLLFLNDDKTPSSSKAGYAQVQWDPIDQLHLTGGIRYTSEEKDYTFNRTIPDGMGTPIAGLDGQMAHYEADSWDYRANISFDLTDDLMVYAQYATGFKGGGSNSQPFFPDQASITFGPEQLETWEGGLKFSGADGRLNLNLAGYYSDYTDIQLQALTCPPPSTPFPCAAALNVGSAHIKGIEAELYAEPVDGFTIDAAVSYLDFDYYELIATAVTPDMISPYTPEWQWSVGAQYEIPFAGGTLIPRVDANYRSSIYINPVNAPTNLLPERTLVNARLSWLSSDEDWEAALEVTNLTDKFYYDNWIDNAVFNGVTFGYPAPPRRWAVTVKRNF